MKKTLQPLYKQEYESNSMFQERIEKRKRKNAINLSYANSAKGKSTQSAWRKTPKGIKSCTEAKTKRNQSPEGIAYNKAYKKTPKNKEMDKAYRQSPAGKKSAKTWRETLGCKDSRKKYNQSPKGRAAQKRSSVTPKSVARRKAYKKSPEGIDTNIKSKATRRVRIANNNVGLPPPDLKAVKAAAKASKWICGWCGLFMPTTDRSIDHIIPVRLCGTNETRNLRYLHRSCNSQKGATADVARTTRDFVLG